jgi:cystathionine beta-lyase
MAAYNHGAAWLDALLAYITGNIDFVRDVVEREMTGVTMSPVEATYLLWLDFRGRGMDAEELKRFMLEEAKVGGNDGAMYGPGGEGFVRLNVATPRSIVEEAFERISAALKKYRS